MSALYLWKLALLALAVVVNWRKENTAVRLAASVTITLGSVVIAIADAAVGNGYVALGWVLNAMLYAYGSASEYWKLFHDAADQESKWAWREWREREYEKKRQRELPVLQLFSGEIPAEEHEPKGTLIAEQQLPRDWLSVEGIGFSVATKPNKGTIH